MFDIKEFHPSIFKDTRKHLLNTKNIYIYINFGLLFQHEWLLPI